MRYEVETESGSTYTIDTELKTFRRKPRPDRFDDVSNSGQDVPYVTLLTSGLRAPLMAIWNDDGRLRLRTSTKITVVREIE